MQQVTVVNLVEAYTRKQRNSVWIVPGNISDFESDENEDRWPHIDDYLSDRGICVSAKLAPEKAVEIASEISKKFSRCGIEAKVELLCND